jgi:hypothetical protein
MACPSKFEGSKPHIDVKMGYTINSICAQLI